VKKGRPEKLEEYVYVLDFLPYGYFDDERPIYQRKPLVQAIGEQYFTLLELTVKEGKSPGLQDRLYIGSGERDVVERVNRRLKFEELTHGAQLELPHVIGHIVKQNEGKYVDFFNNATPITTRLHALELLPGVGKKLMWAILEERKKGEFKDFEDLANRVKGLHNPMQLIVRRIIAELKDPRPKYRLFT